MIMHQHKTHSVPHSHPFSFHTRIPLQLSLSISFRRRLISPSIFMAAGSDVVNPSNTRVGWIGTGIMGGAMCARLIRAGYSLTVFNRTPSKAQPLLDMGAKLVDSPLTVASQSDVVFTIVGYPSDVRSVLIDPTSGALYGLRPGGVLVDMTTSDPSLAVEIAAAASSKGCYSVDAPVSGGDRGAKNGNLSIFAGGDESIIRRINPLLSLIGKVNYMGGSGKGQYGKLANQINIATTVVGIAEGLLFAYKAGLDVGSYLEAISMGAAGSKSLDVKGKQMVNRDFKATFYIDHYVKDLGICLHECQKMGLALPGLALAQHLYLSLKACGEGVLGTQSLILALERLNNISLGSAAPSS